jgi:predicted membrane-bound spermidine synthase
VIIDDGRRYLERTSEQFDVITIDPPPPVSAAGSSLLYSTEFYRLAKQRLRPHGILQQWLPRVPEDPFVRASVAQALKLSFPYVRVFYGFEGMGFHFLASESPLPELDAQQLARKLGPAAERDFVEWGPESTPKGQFERLLENEVLIQRMIAAAPEAPPLADDRPVNEYFVLRDASLAAPELPTRETRAQLPR